MVYLGSKKKYCKYIIPIIQDYIKKNNIKTFIDGMCGGCNVIESVNCENKIAYDANPYLIDLYQKAVYENLEFPEKITREDWDSCKNSPEANPAWKVALVAFFTSYSARGFSGGFAMNGTRDYYKERLNNFKKQIPLLEGIKFETKNVFDIDTKDCLIYLDPPYINTKQYDISKHFNHVAFWEKVRELSKDNIVLVSEQEAPDDFKSIWSLDVKRTCFNANGKSATENLFIYNGEKND